MHESGIYKIQMTLLEPNTPVIAGLGVLFQRYFKCISVEPLIKPVSLKKVDYTWHPVLHTPNNLL